MMYDRLSTLDFFASELRRARTAAGLSQAQLAEAVAYSESLVAMVETTRRTPSQDFTRRCDEALNTGGLLSRILDELVSREFAPEWFRPWISLEREATALCAYQPDLMPGLLQTADYMRAVFLAGGPLPADEVEQHVAARLDRQQVLHRNNPPLVIAILDEVALRRPIGGTKVMHEQLNHLADVNDQGLARVQIVPMSVGMYPGLNGAFVLASFGNDGEMVFIDGPIRGQIIENAADVALIKRNWEDLRCEALPRRQSIELIREVAESWNA